MTAKALLTSLAILLGVAAPAHAAVVINEVESSGVFDFIELTNTGLAEEDIGGYILKDDNNNRTFAIPVGTKLAPGGYYAARVDAGPGNFGLGEADSARVYNTVATELDTYSWTAESPTTYGRCPNGTGAMQITTRPSPNVANACPVAFAASPWPGGTSIATADVHGAFTNNMSGLAYQPSGTAARGTLWAVRNSSGDVLGRLYKLTHNGTNWVDAQGWAGGKRLLYSTGFGEPDAEGLTLVGDDPNAVYVAVERDGGGGSDPKVLRYDVSGAGATLTATLEWSLGGSLEPLGPNQGPEAIAWMPDDVLVAKGLLDESKGARYNPADYPGHGAGLFFVGIEQDGSIAAFALTSGSPPVMVAQFASGFINVQDLEYEPESKLLWAACDNNCEGRTSTLDVAPSGRFAPTAFYQRPAGMDNFNNEGFAIAPQAECANSRKPAFWLDDTNALGHALREGSIRCTEPQPPCCPTIVTIPRGTDPVVERPVAPVDRTPPSIRITLTKPTRAGANAVRKTGKLRLTVALSERADLTLTATARKSAKAKPRALTKTTRRGASAGRTNITLTLSRKVRAGLKAGETITLTVRAVDAAGNPASTTLTAKVR